MGIILTSCMSMAGMLQWGMRQSALLENTMTSVERILEYGRLESEAELETDGDKKHLLEVARESVFKSMFR